LLFLFVQVVFIYIFEFFSVLSFSGAFKPTWLEYTWCVSTSIVTRDVGTTYSQHPTTHIVCGTGCESNNCPLDDFQEPFRGHEGWRSAFCSLSGHHCPINAL
jgi:hypothetical protein